MRLGYRICGGALLFLQTQEANLILGGVVRYEDGVKTTTGDQFSPTRKVSVELNFAVPEDPGIDADSVVQEVLDKAQSFVQIKLGLKVATVAAKTVVVQTTTPTPAVEGPKKRGPKPKPVVVQVPLTEGDKSLLRAAGEDWDTGNSAASVAVPTTVASDPIASGVEEDWDAAPEVVEITDKTLNDKVQVKNGTLKNPLKIRQLIGSFMADSTRAPVLREIPQEKRQEFLDRLEALS